MATIAAPSPVLRFTKTASALIAVGLLAVMTLLSLASARQESQTFDEATHLYAGFEYWKHADFGRNPEHPPLAKLVATAPLLSMGLREPTPPPIPFFKAQDVMGGSQLLYTADADSILLRARAMMLVFALGLGVLVFLAGREMFGETVALLALTIFAFEPVVLSNAPLVTTDMALACMFFASVYTFYRFVRRPGIARLLLCCLCCALTLATKHSGVLILPTLALLAAADLLLVRPDPAPPSGIPRQQLLGIYLGALAAIAVVSYLGLWAIYGFRYAARPAGLYILPSLAQYAAGLPSPIQRSVIAFLAQHHTLPEAYLFGWVDILLIPSYRPTFVLGHLYDSSRWFYLPATFLIKSTLLLLILLLLAPFARIRQHRRELLFLGIPFLFYFAASVYSHINMGVRHVLPVYPFAILLAAAAAATFAMRSRAARIAVTAGLAWTIVSCLHCYPDFLAYSNEAFGGPARTYRNVIDANADWGQTLKWTRTYLDRNSISDCWIAYTNPTVPVKYYGIPCKPLLSSIGYFVGIPVGPTPPRISGVVLLNGNDRVGWGWGRTNPYAPFQDRKPDDKIANVTLVYRGTFDVPLLSAYSNSVLASALIAQHQTAQALALAQAAYAQAPNSAAVNATLSYALAASGRQPEADQYRQAALHLANAGDPFESSIVTRTLAESTPPPQPAARPK